MSNNMEGKVDRKQIAIPAEYFARAVALAISRSE